MLLQEAPLSETEPIRLHPRAAHAGEGEPKAAIPAQASASTGPSQPTTTFNRRELNEILAVYGRKVAAGEWRDYALDFGKEKAVFSVFRRSSEVPLYRIEKNPKLARKQGAYSVVTATGLILKRGHELGRVLDVLEKRVRLVPG